VDRYLPTPNASRKKGLPRGRKQVNIAIPYFMSSLSFSVEVTAGATLDSLFSVHPGAYSPLATDVRSALCYTESLLFAKLGYRASWANDAPSDLQIGESLTWAIPYILHHCALLASVGEEGGKNISV
jgi:hypothetical protein